MNRKGKKNKMARLFSLLVLLSLVLVPATLVYADCAWTQQNPASSPSARQSHAMATIGGGQALLFGGWDGSTPSNETWVYDLGEDIWTLQSPDVRPSARLGHAMATIGGDQVLLFGGYDDETWLYDLSDDTWTLQSPTTSPPARSSHALVYLGGDQVLLFGGWDSSTSLYFDDTWVYDLSANTWTLQSPTTSPSARSGHDMAPIDGDQVLLFGGVDEYNHWHNDTWVYMPGDNTWKLLSPAAQPSVRHCHKMASVGGDQVLLFGGFISGSGYDGETWVYDLGDDTWTLQNPAIYPSARTNHAMASIGPDQVLLFGGYDGAHDAETWIVTGSIPTAITLTSFDTSVAAGNAIRLGWETSNELDNLGFNLYRRDALDGRRVQLNADLIPGQAPGSPVGAAYTWLDESVTPGVTYTYWLEAVDVHGAATLHGPVSATVQPMRRLLPARPRRAPTPPSLRSR